MNKILLAFLFLILFPAKAFADSNFDISVSANYQVSEAGITRVSQAITIENKKEFIYTPSYSISTGLKDISNAHVVSKNADASIILKKTEDGNELNIEFNEKIIGLGKKNEFTVSFETKNIASKQGSIWEIDIPGLSNPDNYKQYNLELYVPQSFGKLSVIKPQKKIISKNIVFSKNEIGKSGIFLLFGQYQYYKFNLQYHISNPNLYPVKTEIALPPDTPYQKVLIPALSPEPVQIYNDDDENVLAVYSLPPKKKLTVHAIVMIRTTSTANPSQNENFKQEHLNSAKYWESTDPQILPVGQNLKTPENIYNFVVSTLGYSYDKVSNNNVRVGAKEAIKKPQFAVCLEFTDLFIALSRAAGIPARSVEGYANTQNSKLRPLSLVKDILHAWPEYYDKGKKQWIMVDPTWGNTTSGLDYFHTFDFDHVVFVRKGVDSTYPVSAGGYKFDDDSKDISVEYLDSSEFVPIEATAVTDSIPQHIFPWITNNFSIYIKNTGNTLILKKPLKITSDLSFSPKEILVKNIFSHSTVEIPIKITPVNFLTNKSYFVTILFDGNIIRKVITVSLLPRGWSLIISGGVLIATIIIIITAYKAGRVFVKKFKKYSNLRGQGKKP